MHTYFVAFAYRGLVDNELRLSNTHVETEVNVSSPADVAMLEQQVSERCSAAMGEKMNVTVINFILLQ